MAKSYEAQQVATSRAMGQAEADYTAVTPNRSPLAPSNPFPERVSNVYERKVAPARTGVVGPLRFEEGLGTDTDLPNEFMHGIRQGYETAPGRPNHNQNVFEKYPDETMRERYHVGSASWVEGPTYLQEFAGGASQEAERKYIEVARSGGRQHRTSPAVVRD